MGYSYTIVQITRCKIDGLPNIKTSEPIPEQHRPYLSSEGRWSQTLADLVFGTQEREFIEGVVYVLNRIPPYEEIAGDLVEEDLDTVWTKKKHEELLLAFRYFAQMDLDFMESY